MTIEGIQVMLYGAIVVKGQAEKALEHVNTDRSILETKSRDCLLKDTQGRYWKLDFEEDNEGHLVEWRRNEVTDDLKYVEWHEARNLIIEE